MNRFATAANTAFARSRLPEIVLEAGLAAGAAAFTAALWLSIGAWAIAPDGATRIAAAQAANATHVTLPTVVIVGRRDSLDGTPVATTAQNTAANPVTLNQ